MLADEVDSVAPIARKPRTIFPGWYSGRAVHAHFKIRTTPASGRAFEFISQLYFPENIISTVHATAAYASHGKADTPNAKDIGYMMGGAQLTPTVSMQADGSYNAVFDIGLRMT
jgi:protocatechuate 3,4-dioxygenase beta subunit